MVRRRESFIVSETETDSPLPDHQHQHDFVDDDLEESVKRRLSYKKDRVFEILGMSPVGREMSLISAAGNLNITKGVPAALTEINKVNKPEEVRGGRNIQPDNISVAGHQHLGTRRLLGLQSNQGRTCSDQHHLQDLPGEEPL